MMQLLKNYKLYYVLAIAATALLVTVSVSVPAYAQETQDEVIQKINNATGGNFGIPDDIRDVNNTTVENVLANVFIAAGGVSIGFVSFGGLKYVISDGDPQKIKQAKDTIVYAIVGLVISLSGFTIVRFVLGRLFG